MTKTEEQILEIAKKVYEKGIGFNKNDSFEVFFEKFKKMSEIMWHHGTCDCCGERLILICHFGYRNCAALNEEYCICEKCLKEQAHLVFSE